MEASSVAPPVNLAELGVMSDAVVFATAQSSLSYERGKVVVTETEFVVVKTLAGGAAAGETIVVECPGGEANDKKWIVGGVPHFEEGTSYLLFLAQKPGNVWLPVTLAYGILREETAIDGQRVLRPLLAMNDLHLAERGDGEAPELLVPYRKADLLAHLGRVLDRNATWDASLVEASNEFLQLKATPPGCVFIGGDLIRWRFEIGVTATIFADQGGDPSLIDSTAFALIPEALDWWESIPGTEMDLSYGGTRNINGTECAASTVDVVIFEDPCDDMASLNGCVGTLAIAGPFPSSGTHNFQGNQWRSILAWIVIVNSGAGCLGVDGYRSMLAHEFGHGLGYGHTSDPQSLMAPNCCNEINSLDVACAQFSYPDPSSPVTNVSCACNSLGGIEMDWTNDSFAEDEPISIEVNGVEVAILPGTDESYTVPPEDLPVNVTSVCIVNGSGTPVCCDFSGSIDCDANGLPDTCDLASPTASDCNADGQLDACELADDPSLDCDGNGTIDSCEIASDPSLDCDSNGILDVCEIADDLSLDCDLEGTLDSCQLAAGAADCDDNGVLDACDSDCNTNSIPDACDILAGTLDDVDGNGVPDECEGFQKPGDVNQDADVDISDQIQFFGFLFGGAEGLLPCGDGSLTHPANNLVLDFNGDQFLDISDGIAGLNWLFSDGAAHALGLGCVPVLGCESVCVPE